MFETWMDMPSIQQVLRVKNLYPLFFGGTSCWVVRLPSLEMIPWPYWMLYDMRSSPLTRRISDMGRGNLYPYIFIWLIDLNYMCIHDLNLDYIHTYTKHTSDIVTSCFFKSFQPTFDSKRFLQEWSAISMEAHELLQQLLSKDPMKRLSAEAALKASWLTKAWHPEYHGSKGFFFWFFFGSLGVVVGSGR